jgi:hypothetical protein
MRLLQQVRVPKGAIATCGHGQASVQNIVVQMLALTGTHKKLLVTDATQPELEYEMTRNQGSDRSWQCFFTYSCHTAICCPEFPVYIPLSQHQLDGRSYTFT